MTSETLKPFLLNLKGKTYLSVQGRIIIFREECPVKEGWGIRTERIAGGFKEQFATYRAEVIDPEGRVIATATKTEDKQGFPDFEEKAECVPLSTAILTAAGWRHWDEVELGDIVAAYNQAEDRLEWVPLLGKRCYQQAPVTRLYNGKGFDVLCTPDHRWPVDYQADVKGKHYAYRRMKETRNLKASDRLTVAAAAPPGRLPVTPTQAAIMGWLITDGSIKWIGKSVSGYICQSKPETVARIRELVEGVPHREDPTPAHVRTFPTGKTYQCRQGFRWHLAAPYCRELLDAFGIIHETELLTVVGALSTEARAAMLEAMMLGDGDKRGNFSQMRPRNEWVVDLWSALCALQGHMVCKSAIRSQGICTIRRKKPRYVYASNLIQEDAGFADVWCPQTQYGTWVARWENDVVAVTGNTGSIGRALGLCGFGTAYALEFDEGEERIVDSPVATPSKVHAAHRGSAARVPAGRVPAAAPADGRPPHGVVGNKEPGKAVAPAGTVPADEVDPALDGAAMKCVKKHCRENLNGYEHSKSIKKFGKPLCPKCYEGEEAKGKPAPVVACSYPGCGLILEDWEVEGCKKKGWGPACKEHRQALKAQEADDKPPLPGDAELKEMFA